MVTTPGSAQELRRDYQSGYNAALEGKHVTDCPHLARAAERRASWVRGYTRGKLESGTPLDEKPKP